MAEPWKSANATGAESVPVSVVKEGLDELKRAGCVAAVGGNAEPVRKTGTRPVKKEGSGNDLAGNSGIGRPRIYADPDARRQEYMREYMRKRRAKP